MMKMLLIWIGICIGFAIVAETGHAQNNAVRIVGVAEGEDIKRTRGTGVLVESSGELFVLTAYHVVRNLQELFLVAGPQQSDEKDPFEAGLVEPKIIVRPDLELCALKVTQAGADWLSAEPRNIRAIRIASTSDPGTRLVAIGNPRVKLFRGETSVRTLHPLNTAASATVARTVSAHELLGELVHRGAMNTQLYELTGVGITYGFSGGPLLREKPNATPIRYELVGVVVGGDPKSGITAWGTTVEGVTDALNDTFLADFPLSPWPRLEFADKVYSLPANVSLQFPARFPSQGFLEQRRVGGGPWHMKTHVTISESGRVDAVTETVTDEFLQGFTGRAVVFLCDASGNVLSTLSSPKYGVPVGISKKRRENWTKQLGDGVIAQVRNVRVEHFHAPTARKLEQAISQLVEVVNTNGQSMTVLKSLADSFQLQLSEEDE